VAPWQVDAVQPVRGHVIVPEPPVPDGSLPPGEAAVPLIAWHVDDVQPVDGQM
jgi:hypothetical protein